MKRAFLKYSKKFLNLQTKMNFYDRVSRIEHSHLSYSKASAASMVEFTSRAYWKILISLAADPVNLDCIWLCGR